MESMREVDRVMEREIKKGSTPIKFEQLGFGDYNYNEIGSKEKLLQVLFYLLRIGEYHQFVGKTIGNNVYMDMRGKKAFFRRTRITYERNNIFAAIKHLAKKYKPDYEGKVYLETVRCFFSIGEEELEKCRYNYQGKDTYAFVLSDKYIMALYTYCLTARKAVALEDMELEGISKTELGVDAMIEQVISSFYIACFCESVLKDTMWSYYANNHKGFCIEYYFNSFESPQFIFPVVYKDSKKIDINNLDESEMYKSILTKYSDWSKEDEWRIALPYYDEKTDGKVIKQPLPKAIYMGVDIEIQLKNFLMQHCEERFIELYQMELDTRRRRLIPKQIL